METKNNQYSDSPKFSPIIDTATELFMRFGIKRVTIEEICKTANISKMTFYKFFKNKIDLAEYIIFSVLTEGQTRFEEIFNSNDPFDEKINRFVQLKLDYAKKFSKEFFLDFMGLSPQIHSRIMTFAQHNQATFFNMIEQAQQNGEVRKDISISFMSFMLNQFMEIRDDEDFIAMYGNLEDLTMDMINFYFYGIMGKKK